MNGDGVWFRLPGMFPFGTHGRDARATIVTIFCQIAQSCYFVPHVSNQQKTGA